MRVNYFEPRKDEDPFPDDIPLDTVEASQHDEVVTVIGASVERAADAGFEGPFSESPNTMVWKNANVFQIHLSSEPPAEFEPSRIELVANAKRVCVRLRNYKQ